MDWAPRSLFRGPISAVLEHRNGPVKHRIKAHSIEFEALIMHKIDD